MPETIAMRHHSFELPQTVIFEMKVTKQAELSKQIFNHSGHNEVVKFFIENGADVNAKNLYNYTALTLAARDGDFKNCIGMHPTNIFKHRIFSFRPPDNS